MPCHVQVGEILQTPELGDHRTVSLWGYGSYGSLWVHPGVVINIPPRSSASNISTTLKTPKEEVVPITVSQYGILVGVEDVFLNSWFILTRSVTPKGVSDSYQELLRPSSFIRNKI